MRFVCVLKSGGDFDMGYVRNLFAGLQKHNSIACKFTCLTDTKDRDIDGVEFVDLKYDFPGWWSKIEVFQFTGPIIYFDLDTIITGDITRLINCVRLVLTTNVLLMLRGFKQGNCASGVMGWSGDLRFIVNAFVALQRKRFVQHSAALRLFVNNKRYRGDQDWLSEFLLNRDTTVMYAQDFMSGIYSFKNELTEMTCLPADASIVCFHGHPRPHELPEAHSLRKHWQ